MKLPASFLISIFICTCSIKAQTKFGVRLGLNLADQNQERIDPLFPQKFKTKILTGYQVGVFSKKNLNKKIMLAAEINFSAIGSKIEYTFTNNSGTAFLDTSYYSDKIYQIEIPLTVQYKIKGFYIGAGATIGIKTASKIEHFLDNTFSSDYYNTIDWGANIIVGQSITQQLDWNLKYFYGLSDINNKTYFVTNTRVATLGLLYSFH